MDGVDAFVAPDRSTKSLRQDQLSQDVRDALAAAFHYHPPMLSAIPICAMEVRIGGDALHNVMLGGDGFHKHAGATSPCYFYHLDDDGWAIVYEWDCDGDVKRGLRLIMSWEPEEK